MTTPVQPDSGAAAAVAGLSQLERVTNIFSVPSKTFKDIQNGNRSWWMPFLIIFVTGMILFGAITKEVTWKGVYENQQRAMPEFAKRMMENMPPEQRAKQAQVGPMNQEVTWALAPFGLLLINVVSAGILLATVNFGFGGRAKFGQILSVSMYAALVVWPIRLLLGAVALFAGATPEGFNIQNVAGTNVGYYLNQQETPAALYYLATALDPLVIWSMALTAIGVATVAGIKRSSGYIAVFGWWALLTLIFTAVAAI